MQDSILHYKSVEHFFSLLGLQKSDLEGFGYIDLADLEVPGNIVDQKVTCEFYCVMYNNAPSALGYGSSKYDLSNGVLTFVAPNQVIAGGADTNSKEGWILCFSPAFLKETKLLDELHRYNLFSYDVNEALNINNEEQQLIELGVQRIGYELSKIDRFSREIVGVELELLLKRCSRAMHRQYDNTRSDAGLLAQIEKLLEEYYHTQQQLQSGLPKIAYLSDKLNLSTKYLSKVIQQATSIKTTDYLNQFVINRAKVSLLTTNKTVQEIAYDLGFSQPHYFAKLFKKYNDNNTPQKYRVQN